MKLNGKMWNFRDDILERRVRERAPAYFGKILRRVRLVSLESLADLLDDAAEKRLITDEEKSEVLWADGVVKGKLKESGEEVWVVFEVSHVVDEKDVEKALERAAILSKVLKVKVLPAAFGKKYAIPKEKIEDMGVIAL